MRPQALGTVDPVRGEERVSSESAVNGKVIKREG
jgi:hypothetical protein